MRHISDDALLEELKRRFRENRNNLAELNKMTGKLQEINAKLMDSEQLKSHFLSNIRNEINNPLTAILGIAQNLMGEKDIDKATVSKMAGMVYAEAFDLDFQLRTIFAAAEIEAGEAYLHASKVDIDELIKRIVMSFTKTAEKRNIELVYDSDLPVVDDQPFIFSTDSEKVHLIVLNLLSNALEYGRTGDKVEVKVEIADGLKVTVRDYGIGIDKSDHEKIFNRFVQLDEGLTKEYKGHGLGLSVIKNTVDFLGGKIDVESEKGSGSAFSIVIPEAEIEDDDIFSMDGNEELF